MSDTNNTDSVEETPVVVKTTLSISVDGRAHEAEPGQLLIDACEDAGSYVPRFCYHPRMEPVGMCRQCLVEVEGPRGPMMVVSCMTPVAEGQVARTDTPGVKRAQEGVLELLLANHPLDCPVCDKGGECPLQDQAFSHGPGESRFVEEKRHYEKPIAISDLVFLDRERCILCDRCTRFADEVAGDPLISFTQRGNNTQVNTFPDEPFASYFSGNTVQICPVGALTAKPYRFKARPWDLEQRESTCTTCSVGCRTVVQSSRDELLRYQGSDSDAVNWGWLCDKGRFNFENVNSGERLEHPLVREGASHKQVSWSDASAAAANALRAGNVAIIGGARGTNEDAFAWARLADALGISMRDAQLADGLPAEVFGLPAATIAEAANATTIILLAPDLKEELPVLFLRLRDAAQKRRSRILEFSAAKSGLSKYAWRTVETEPGAQVAAVRSTLADADVRAQIGKGNVVVVAGRANLAESADNTVAALSVLLAEIPGAKVLPVVRRGNVRGAIAAGINGGNTAEIFKAAVAGKVDTLVLLGADPIADFPDSDLARRAVSAVRNVIALDTFLTESSSRASIVLPVSGYGEKDGTTTNLEGRVTSVARKVTARGTSRADWMVAVDLASRLGIDLGFDSVASIQRAMAATAAFAAIDGASDREGVMLVVAPSGLPSVSSNSAERNSYDFRLVVSRRMYDQGISTSKSPSLAHLAQKNILRVHPAELSRIGVADGATVKVTSARTSIQIAVTGDDSVARGVAQLTFNAPGINSADLVGIDSAVTDVRVETL
mgnify:FL=1